MSRYSSLSRRVSAATLPFSFGLSLLATPASALEVSIQTLPDRVAMVVERTTPTSELGVTLGQDLPEVYNFLVKNHVSPLSAPIVQYLSYSESETHYRAGFVVAASLPADGSVTATTLPGGKHAVATHVGPYEELGVTYKAMMDWCSLNDYVPEGASVEEYIDDPTTTPPAALRTVISMPVRSL